MSLVDEIQLWSAIAGRMTIEMEMNLATHAEARVRNEIVIEEAEGYIWLMRRAAGEWQRALGYLRREYDVLGDRIAEDRRRAAADYEAEEMRRQKETRDTAATLRREVESLSALRDRLRDEVSSLTQANTERAAANASLNNGDYSATRGTYPQPAATSSANASYVQQQQTNGNASMLNLGSPIPHHHANASYVGGPAASSSTAHTLGGSSYAAAPPPPSSSLGVLRSVRDQLREIRENNNVSPPRGATPQRSSSPSAQQWKERLSKLQGDLRTLRSELGATPQRPPAVGSY